MQDKEEITKEDENDYVFTGLISMIDPPRVESKDAVHKCIMAGIKPVMITGDHKVTAAAIAREIGIMGKDDIAVEGLEIDKLNDEQLKKSRKIYLFMLEFLRNIKLELLEHGSHQEKL